MSTADHNFNAVIFDLDGVITKTALVHAAAWKEMFDEYLHVRSELNGEPFRPFTHEHDYLPYVDGKPRYEGVKSFLESRRIFIPFGDPQDSPEQETVCALGNRKNEKFKDVLRKNGVDVYAPCIVLAKELKASGIRVGVASSSKNCQLVLQKAGLESLFEVRVDGMVSAQQGLKGKPEPDIFIRAAKLLGADPQQSVVVEDAVSGVQAGRNGNFALVIGVAREQNEKELKENGADIVVTDFKDVDTARIDAWISQKKHR